MAAWNRISWGDLFTLANGVLGFIAITYILDQKYISAIGLLFVSMMMDGLDGYIARRFGSKHSMGQVLDSISDAISFAFAPAILVYAEFHGAMQGTLVDLIVLGCAVAILASGLFRLARFSASGYQLDYFVVFEEAWLVLGVGFLASVLMASEIPYPKIHGWMATASGLAVLLAVLPYLTGSVLVADQSLYRAFSRTATGIALALTAVYVFGGPIYEKVKGSHS